MTDSKNRRRLTFRSCSRRILSEIYSRILKHFEIIERAHKERAFSMEFKSDESLEVAEIRTFALFHF